MLGSLSLTLTLAPPQLPNLLKIRGLGHLLTSRLRLRLCRRERRLEGRCHL